MGLSNDKIQRAILISKYIQEYLIQNNLSGLKPKDLMPLLISHGIFTKDNKKGLPLRNILRELDREGQLDLIPQSIADRKSKNISWSFMPVRENNNTQNEIINKPEKDKEISRSEQIHVKAKTVGNTKNIIPEGCKTCNERNSSIKLIPIANIVKELLEEKFRRKAYFIISETKHWLPVTPNKDYLSYKWHEVCDIYEKLNGFNLKLEEVLKREKPNLNTGIQETDIWFKEPFNFFVEFDEDQHFNQFRLIILNEYKEYEEHSFDYNEYINLSKKIIKPGKMNNGFKYLKKPDPLFPPSKIDDQQDNRIRQRAFRDFLKDVTPSCLNLNPTIRISYKVTNGNKNNFTDKDIDNIKLYFVNNKLLEKLTIE